MTTVQSTFDGNSRRTKATNEERDYDGEAALYEAMAAVGHIPTSHRRGEDTKSSRPVKPAPRLRGSEDHAYALESNIEPLQLQAFTGETSTKSTPTHGTQQCTPESQEDKYRQNPRSSPEMFSFSVSPTSTEASDSPDQYEQDTQNGVMEASSSPDEETMQIIMGLKSCLVEDTQIYLDSLMNTAIGLPPTVVTEIREEVEARLHARVASTLSNVLQGYSESGHKHSDISGHDILLQKVNGMIADALEAAEAGGSWDGGADGVEEAQVLNSEYTVLLQNQLHQLRIARCNDEDEEHSQASLKDFSRALLGAPDIRREVEPLVAFLTIFAAESVEQN